MDIDREDINIDKSEVMRYLGYSGQNMDASTDKDIDDIICEAGQLIRPRVIYRYFNLKWHDDYIALDGTEVILKGKSIMNHLRGCSMCCIMAGTIGLDIEKKISYYEAVGIYKAILLDAAASAAIEDVMDSLCRRINLELGRDSKMITDRYSPGYGDFSIDIQKEILNIIDSYKLIGLTANKNSILIPRKSVTAVCGVNNLGSVKKSRRGCSSCMMYKNCKFKKEGKCFGYKI